MTTITNCFGLKRDAYYNYKHRADKHLKLEQQIVQIIKHKRKSLPREGVRKLKISLQNDFDNATLKVGRGTLFNVLRKHNMLTTRKKLSCRNTKSTINIYNQIRLHVSLDYKTPYMVYKLTA